VVLQGKATEILEKSSFLSSTFAAIVH
jgi:hypothetical protein